jgi:orotidine-5'-phosphate decarboxylase
MLGVKSTCKDRWRQVLSEAERIKAKHLLTLEPGISANQTQEMRANKLNLIVPLDIQNTYKPAQLKHILDVKTFLHLVEKRQHFV